MREPLSHRLEKLGGVCVTLAVCVLLAGHLLGVIAAVFFYGLNDGVWKVMFIVGVVGWGLLGGRWHVPRCR